MSRKTYHHLKAGDLVPIEHYQWAPDGGLEILEEVEGEVVEVFERRVAIEFQMRIWEHDVPWQEQRTFPTVQHFSRQGGQRWGAGEDDYRIKPDQARRKS